MSYNLSSLISRLKWNAECSCCDSRRLIHRRVVWSRGEIGVNQWQQNVTKGCTYTEGRRYVTEPCRGDDAFTTAINASRRWDIASVRGHLWLMHDAALPQSLPLCVRSTDALRIYGNFLAAVQAAAATPTSAGGHWPPDRGENASPLSLSHSLAFPCIRNTVLRIRGAVLTQFSDTIQRRGAIWTGHRSRNAVNRGDVKIVLQRLIAPLDRSECGLTSSRKYNSCRRTRRGRN